MFKKKNTENANPQKKAIYKQKAVGLVIGLIGVSLLLLLIFYVVSRIFRPEDLANFLPKDTTIAVVQVSVNSRLDQVEEFYQALNKYEIYKPQNVTKLLNEALDIDFSKDVEPWISRQIGFAFLEKKNSPGEIENLIFIEIKDKNKAIDFMKARGLKDQEDYVLSEDYLGYPIYRYALSQTYNFTFINSYLVVAGNPDALKIAIEAAKGSSPRLKDNPLYQKISQNLPIKSLAFIYVDFQKMINVLKTNSNFMSEKGRDLLAFEPFLKFYKGFGTVFVMQNKNLTVQTYTSLEKEFMSFDNKFRGNLLKYLSKDIVFYAGGSNLHKQIQRYSDIFGSGGEVSYLIFEGILNAQKNKYFGSEISLNEDIYPLLEGEYAYAVSKIGEDTATTLILELQDPIRDKDKISVIVDSFVSKSALLSPKVVEVTLEDGTVTKEIQTTPEEITKSSEDYRGYQVNILNISNQPWGIYYIILDKNLVVTTKKENMHNIIDLMVEPSASFINTDEYRNVVLPVLNSSDEILFLNSDYLYQFVKDILPGDISPYLAPVKSISSGNNYFNDGISSINYLKID